MDAGPFSLGECTRILDIMHVTAQGVVAGANMILVDFRPDPGRALVDGPQALLPDELPQFLEDVRIARDAYERRQAWRNVVRSEFNRPRARVP